MHVVHQIADAQPDGYQAPMHSPASFREPHKLTFPRMHLAAPSEMPAIQTCWQISVHPHPQNSPPPLAAEIEIPFAAELEIRRGVPISRAALSQLTARN